MRALTRGIVLVSFFVLAGWCRTAVAQGQPDGQLTVAFDASIAPVFLDPAETPGIGTPFVFLYALHGAVTDTDWRQLSESTRARLRREVMRRT